MILDQQPTATFEYLFGRFIGVFLNRASGFGQCLVQVLHDMETIYHTSSIEQLLFRRFLVSVPHVRAGYFDCRTPLAPAFIQPFQQVFLAAIFQNVQDQSQFWGRDDQNKLAMPSMQRNLIKANRSHLWVAACLNRFFALCSKIACVASSLRPSSCATWLTLSRRTR